MNAMPAMRSIWNGAITFGLISIPVRLFTAVEEKSLKFHQLHASDNGRIRYKRVCSIDEEEVPYDEIVKGYEYEKDRYVVFSDEELERLPSDSIRAVDVVSFVPLEEIDPIYFQKSYYLAPEPTGIKAYRLLARALQDSGRVAIAKFTLREKERLATLRLHDGVFVLETMYWPDEIRRADFDELEKDVEIRPQELAMAKTLIDNLTDHFQPDQFTDSYRQRLEAAAEAKIAGQEVAVAPTAEPTQILDLMEALKASVEATKAKREAAEVEPAEAARAAGCAESLCVPLRRAPPRHRCPGRWPVPNLDNDASRSSLCRSVWPLRSARGLGRLSRLGKKCPDRRSRGRQRRGASRMRQMIRDQGKT